MAISLMGAPGGSKASGALDRQCSSKESFIDPLNFVKWSQSLG